MGKAATNSEKGTRSSVSGWETSPPDRGHSPILMIRCEVRYFSNVIWHAWQVDTFLKYRHSHGLRNEDVAGSERAENVPP
jgi:hypothetical protein